MCDVNEVMPRMTTREKFRARRKARAEMACWHGMKWRPSDMHRMRMQEARPAVFNVIGGQVMADGTRALAGIWRT